MAGRSQAPTSRFLKFVVYERLDLSRSWINPEAIKQLRLCPEGCLMVQDEREEIDSVHGLRGDRDRVS